jgi:hypothetical protein
MKPSAQTVNSASLQSAQQVTAIRSPKEAGSQNREMVYCIHGSFTSVIGGDEERAVVLYCFRKMILWRERSRRIFFVKEQTSK